MNSYHILYKGNNASPPALIKTYKNCNWVNWVLSFKVFVIRLFDIFCIKSPQTDEILKPDYASHCLLFPNWISNWTKLLKQIVICVSCANFRLVVNCEEIGWKFGAGFGGGRLRNSQIWVSRLSQRIPQKISFHFVGSKPPEYIWLPTRRADADANISLFLG